MTSTNHPEYKLPDTPHAKARYASAMRHVEAAKAAGKSSAEIHAIFKRVMEFDVKDIETLSKDGPHGKYRSAVIHAQKALANGKSREEAHAIYQKIMSGEANKDAHK